MGDPVHNSIVKNKDFATDTLIVFDGLLRSKVFARDLFNRYLELMSSAIDRQRGSRRRLFLVGVAKHSKKCFRATDWRFLLSRC